MDPVNCMELVLAASLFVLRKRFAGLWVGSVSSYIPSVYVQAVGRAILLPRFIAELVVRPESILVLHIWAPRDGTARLFIGC